MHLLLSSAATTTVAVANLKEELSTSITIALASVHFPLLLNIARLTFTAHGKPSWSSVAGGEGVQGSGSQQLQ